MGPFSWSLANVWALNLYRVYKGEGCWDFGFEGSKGLGSGGFRLEGLGFRA